MIPLRPRCPRIWICFFAVLTVLTLVWTGGSLLFERYYWGSTVTPERLAHARGLWQKMGATDYDLEVIQPVTTASRVVVHVRGGKVVYAEPDDRPLSVKRDAYGMPALFELMQRMLERDGQSGARPAVAVARFDPHDGHLVRYLHHPRGAEPDLQIIVKNYLPQDDERAGLQP